MAISGNFGLRLRHARKLRKMTQHQLAGVSGIKQPSLSELETGETKEISGPVLIAISKALRVRPEWLMTGKAPMEHGELEALTEDERELLQNYRAAQPVWRISIRHTALLRADPERDAAAEALAKIVAQPVAKYKARE